MYRLLVLLGATPEDQARAWKSLPSPRPKVSAETLDFLIKEYENLGRYRPHLYKVKGPYKFYYNNDLVEVDPDLASYF